MRTAKDRARDLVWELVCTSEVVESRAKAVKAAVDAGDYSRAAELLSSCAESADLVAMRHADAVAAVAKARFE